MRGQTQGGLFKTRINSALRAGSPVSDRCLTAVTVTGGAVDGYALLFEGFDDPAHALPRVLRGMFGQPRREVKVCL